MVDQEIIGQQNVIKNEIIAGLRKILEEPIGTYIEQAEAELKWSENDSDFNLKDVRQNIHLQHKINFNNKKQILTSNLLMVAKNQKLNLIKKYLKEIKLNLQNEYNKALEQAPDDLKKYVSKIEVVIMELHMFINI